MYYLGFRRFQESFPNSIQGQAGEAARAQRPVQSLRAVPRVQRAAQSLRAVERVQRVVRCLQAE